MHVDSQDQVENERAKDQPDRPDHQVSPPIREVQRLAIATRLSLGFVSFVAGRHFLAFIGPVTLSVHATGSRAESMPSGRMWHLVSGR